ncbi:unnamed protein product [Hymenolepis diminuta]|uniref:Uncharacterized protein n=1 Tax=Hymenolepis diminuta TaxID=6216 RepID=A0A3P6XKR2_HYMDI|nr:unnamed protein product [Hymenolepis diminuta]
MANCELTWSDVADTDLHSIANCGLLQSSQLHPLCCTFRVRYHAEKGGKPASLDNALSEYTCRMYFLQQDQRIEGVIAELKAAESESLSSQKTPADGNKPGTQLANTKGSNLGVAGPPGAFPLMVAAETLAASFGVHMNRIQTTAGVGGESANTRSPISLKKSPFVTSKSGSCSAPLQPPSHETTVSSQDIASSHHKSSLLRSTFARMRQVATGTMNSSSSTATTPAVTATTTSSSSSPLATPSSGASATSATATPSRSGFHQRLTHFSQTFTHDNSSEVSQAYDLPELGPKDTEETTLTGG